MSILTADHVSKQYPGTLALDDVSVSFDSGRVHAFIGKNGSGKSTLLKIFSGAIKPTGGSISLNGEKLSFDSPRAAFANGIATVYQELSLVPNMTVTENILLGRLPMKHGMVDMVAARKRAAEVLNSLDLDIDPDVLAGELSAGKRQMVEIAKAMSFDPKVLQLDEPTAALSKSETEALFTVVRRLKEKDVIIIYVSHKLHELWKIADTCTVLRDGKYIGTCDMASAERKDIVHMMFGETVVKTRPTGKQISDEVVLKVDNLCRKDAFQNVSFELHKGEVLGIAGMLGSGRTELLRSIFGADKFDLGKITMFGEEVDSPSPQKMKARGLAMIQENRNTEGLIACQSIRSNLCRASIDRLGKGILVKRGVEKQLSEKQVRDLQIKIASDEDLITSLSGGNAQKVVVGSWLNTEPKIIFFDEPSKGIDVNAKQQIFQIMWDQAEKGISSIMVSTELEELIEVCDRILIMREGELGRELKPENTSVDELYTICMGG